MLKPFALFIGTAFLAALGSAQVTRSGAGYLLRVKYTRGLVLRYASSNAVSGATGAPENGLKFSLPIVFRIEDVKGPVAKARISIGPAKMGANVLQNVQTVVMSINNRNEATSGAAGPAVGAQLPEKPVKVGSTWNAMAPIATGTGTQRLKATYRFQGVKAVGGKKVAVISYSVAGAARGTGTMTLLAEDGTLWSNDTKLSISTGGTAPMTVTSTLKRV